MDVDNTPTRVEELWFSDGGLVIQAEQSLYRVSGAILAARSPVFKDMLSFTQPPDAETIDGCPVVRLPDSAADVTRFFKAIFDSSYFEPHPYNPSLDVIISILHMSNKYAVDYLLRRALVHLSSDFPTTLIGALWILPGAFNDLASNDDATIHQILNCVAHNTSPANLSGSDQILFLKTTLQFSRQENFIVRFLHSWDIIAGCEGSKKCARARVHAMAKVQDHIEKSAPLGPDPLNLCRNAKIWKLLSDACDNCDRSFRTAHKEDRQALWDKLPEFLGEKLIINKHESGGPDSDAFAVKVRSFLAVICCHLFTRCLPQWTRRSEFQSPLFIIAATELWFSDGGLVVQAEQSLYRVSGAILAARSPVFKDMLSFTQPPDAETIDGCPVVRLPDSAADVTCFFKAIFDFSFFEPHPYTYDFNTIISVLHLSNKYAVVLLLRRALVHLSSAFPTELSGYDVDENGSIYYDDDDVTSYVVAAIQIAREVNALWVLPSAFYYLVSTGNITTHPALNCVAFNNYPAKLSGDDQTLFLKTSLHISRQENLIVRFLHSPDTIPKCEGSKKCVKARVRALAKVQDYIAEQTDGPSPLNLCKSAEVWELLSDACCGYCYKSFVKKHEEDRQALWNKLPEFCGLPPWPELEEMKAAALQA
ncbi:hypothetical protein B0H13DRAFT_1701204 [Mycena leptocephala]|nr:hypothetical protein B0H13DRAFT_1701204 [Mycena leptocephala]